ncbi:unnamed protein product [Rotaria sp. Silwood1]|nr:unnamed protein product [Rotaria sp. Silwood1]
MNLHSNSTKVHVDGLYILIVPKNEFGQDLTEYHANKMRRVQRKVDDLRKSMLVLYPINLNVNMVIMITPGEHNFDRSTFNINTLIEQITANIDSKQFSDLLDFGKFQNYSTLYERCREYRQLHLQESLQNTLLTEEQKDRVKILETKLDVFNLAYIRHSVEIEIENKTTDSSLENTQRNNYHRWNWWWRKKHKHHHNHSHYHNHNERIMSITSLEAYHDDGFSFYFEDLSNIIIDIRITKLDLNLVSSSLIINKFELNFPNFRLYGIEDNKSNRRLLVESISKCFSPLLHIQFELFPINIKRSDYRFHLNIQPIRIIYHAAMFNRIVECFEPNINQNSFSLSEIKQRQYEEMENDLYYQKVFDMTIELNHISIIFPKNGHYNQNTSMFNIDFRQLTLKSCLDENQIDSQEKNLEERFYIKYKLEINDLQIIYYTSDGSHLHLLRKTPSIDIYFYKCIYFDDANLDDWHIHLKTNSIGESQISNKILHEIIDHFKSIPLFNSTLSEILYRINLYFEIFRPNTSLKGNISIHQCSTIILVNQKVSIKTGLYISISKTRKNIEEMIIILKNLTMTTIHSLSNSFYLNEHLKLNYINNSTRLQLTD